MGVILIGVGVKIIGMEGFIKGEKCGVNCRKIII